MLERVIERAMALNSSDSIELEDLPPARSSMTISPRLQRALLAWLLSGLILAVLPVLHGDGMRLPA